VKIQQVSPQARTTHKNKKEKGEEKKREKEITPRYEKGRISQEHQKK
jgi:hypothetical protein